MKTYILPSIKITVILLVILGGLYPLAIAAVGKLTRAMVMEKPLNSKVAQLALPMWGKNSRRINISGHAHRPLIIKLTHQAVQIKDLLTLII